MKELFSNASFKSFVRAVAYLFLATAIASFILYGFTGSVESLKSLNLSKPSVNTNITTVLFITVLPFLIYWVFIGSRGWFSALSVKNEQPYMRRIAMRSLLVVILSFNMAFFAILYNYIRSTLLASEISNSGIISRMFEFIPYLTQLFVIFMHNL